MKTNNKIKMVEILLSNWENQKETFFFITEILRDDSNSEEFFLDINVFNKSDEEFWKETKEKFSKELYEYMPRFFIFSDILTGEQVGFIILKPISFLDGKIKYTIGLKREFRNKGYGFEMLKLFFEKLESIKWVYKVNVLVFGWNIGSQKLHDKFIKYLKSLKDKKWNVNFCIRKNEIVFREKRENLLWYEFFYLPRE